MPFLVSYTNQTTKRFKTSRPDSLYLASQNLKFSYPNNIKWHHDDVVIVFLNLSTKLADDNLQHWNFAGW